MKTGVMGNFALCRFLLMLLPYHLDGCWGSSNNFGVQIHKDVKFNREHTGVYFDPDDFMEGNRLSWKMDASGMEALIRKIHTKFDKLMISFPIPNQRHGENSTNHILVPEVVAKQNQLLNQSHTQPMEVIALFKVSNWENKPDLKDWLNQAQEELDKANDIFPGTVKVILLDMTGDAEVTFPTYLNFRHHFRRTGLIHPYMVGVQVDLGECRHYSTSSQSTLIYSSWMHGVGLEFVDKMYFSYRGIPSNSKDISEQDVQILTTQFSHCKELVQLEGKGTEVGFIATWPDTDPDGHVKYSNLVTFWEEINNWAVNTSTHVVIHQAFDTPFSRDTLMKSNGWWRLHPDSIYEHPSQFLFEGKEHFVNESTIPNVTWMRPELEFCRSCVGVSYSPVVLVKDVGKSQSYREARLAEQIKTISTTFSTILISSVSASIGDGLVDLSLTANSTFLIPEIVAKLLNGNEQVDEVAVTMMNVVMMFDEMSSSKVIQVASQANLIFPGTVKRLIYHPTNFDSDNPQDSKKSMTLIKSLEGAGKFDLGINFPLERCTDQIRFSKTMGVTRALPLTISNIYFSANVTNEISLLGVDRVLPLYIAMFENCRNKVDKYFSNFNESMETGFLTGWPLVGEESLERNVAFVRFWEELNEWAINANTTIILNSAFDPPDRGTFSGSSRPMYGWWKLLENETLADASDEYIFEDKKNAALRYATEKHDKGDKPIFGTWEKLALLFLCLFLLVGLLAGVYKLRKRNSTSLTKQDIADFINDGDGGCVSQHELGKRSFTIDVESPLGSGVFGKVCCGTVTKERGQVEEVAVKMTKVNCLRTTLRGFLFEIKILSFLGRHPNIVELVGAYTAELKKSRVYIFLEICSLGSLENYLRKLRPASKRNSLGSELDVESISISENSSDCQQKSNELEEELTRDMSRWSREIATGMEFIASKHVVHLDIATRNVLLTSQKQAKITDFGLSRRMHDFQTYAKKSQEPLPWRWMSPEALRKSEFTEKSDVWAFGVTLWEIYTLGEEPYPGLSWDVNFPTKLERGLRLVTPAYNADSMYSLMLRCWTTNPERRPTFSELVTSLTPISTENEYSEGIDVQLSSRSIPVIGICNKEGMSAQQNHQSGKVKGTTRCICLMWLISCITLNLLIIAIASLTYLNLNRLQDGISQPVNTSATIHSIKGNGTSSILFHSHISPDDETLTRSRKPTTEGTTVSQITSSTESMRFIGYPGKTQLGNGKDTFRHFLNRSDMRKDASMMPELHRAILGGNLSRIKQLVQAGADVNSRTQYGSQTPLHQAAFALRLDVITYLLENGANAYAVDKANRTFLHTLLVYPPIPTPSQFHTLSTYLISKNYTQLFDTFGDCCPESTPLLLALNKVELREETLVLLRNNSINFDAVNQYGISSLGYAVAGGRGPKVLSQLILFGVDAKRLDANNRSLVHQAAVFGNVEGLEFLSKLGFDLNGRDGPHGNTPLHLALSQGQVNTWETAKLLVELGADINARNRRLRTPLQSAVQNPERNPLVRIAVIKYLIGQGANTSVEDGDGLTFLHSFIGSAGNGNEIHLVSEYLMGANLSKLFNAHDRKHGVTPLHFLVYRFEVAIGTLKLLHNHSVDFNAHDLEGNSILAFAIKGGRSPQFLRNLVHLGAELKHLNYRNQSLLHNAVDACLVEVLDILLELGSDVNVADLNGRTPLHNAVHSVRGVVLEMTKLLVSRGADVNARNKRGRTPLHECTRNQQIDNQMVLKVMEYLIGNGADVFAQDDKGSTFLPYFIDRIVHPIYFDNAVAYLVGRNYSRLFDATMEEGLIVLQFAVFRIQVAFSTLDLLHRNGVNFHAVDQEGNSLLVYALLGGRGSKFLAQLLQLGADWRVPNKRNQSLLHYAAERTDIEVLKLALSLELDINGVDFLGFTPLHRAVINPSYGTFQTVQLLIENGADVHTKTRNGITPARIWLQKPRVGDWEEVAKLLMDRGNGS